MRLGGVQDFLRRSHYAEINDLKVIALEDDTDNVFTNVMNVALYCC